MDPSVLLGPLEAEVMRVMWEKERATVRQVVDALQARRSVAYTTVMTIMNNLVTKGLLSRITEGKAYSYIMVLSSEAFLEQKSREAVSEVITRFGDLAIARFMEAVARLKPEDLERLQQLAARKELERKEGGQP
jgi:predicted transcriptional regulator